MGFEQYIAPEILDKFEYHNYGHALEILHESFPNEWGEWQDCLKQLRLTIADISTSGGNESPIPKKFDALDMAKVNGYIKFRKIGISLPVRK